MSIAFTYINHLHIETFQQIVKYFIKIFIYQNLIIKMISCSCMNNIYVQKCIQISYSSIDYECKKRMKHKQKKSCNEGQTKTFMHLQQ